MSIDLTRLDKFISERKIVRHRWGDGETCACLVVAIVPQIAVDKVLSSRYPELPLYVQMALVSIDDDGPCVPCNKEYIDNERWWARILRVQKLLHKGLPDLNFKLGNVDDYLDAWERHVTGS